MIAQLSFLVIIFSNALFTHFFLQYDPKTISFGLILTTFFGPVWNPKVPLTHSFPYCKDGWKLKTVLFFDIVGEYNLMIEDMALNMAALDNLENTRP